MGILDYIIAKAVTETWREARQTRQEEFKQKQAEYFNLSKSLEDINRIKKHIAAIDVEIEQYICSYDFSYSSDFLDESFLTDSVTSKIMIERKKCIEILKNCADENQIRCHLIELLVQAVNSYKYRNPEIAKYLIDECRYHIRKLLSELVITNQTVAIKHLLLAIDAELYIIQGNYVDALKTYYKILNWDQMLKNVYETNSWDRDGTEDIYVTVVSNLINIFALLSLPKKAEETRICFSKIISITKEDIVYKINNLCLTPDMVEYYNLCSNAFNASYKPIGFYMTSALNVDFSDEGLWKSHVLSEPGTKKDIYNTCYFVINVSTYDADGFSYNNWNEPIPSEEIIIQRGQIKMLFNDVSPAEIERKKAIQENESDDLPPI